MELIQIGDRCWVNKDTIIALNISKTKVLVLTAVNGGDYYVEDDFFLAVIEKLLTKSLAL